MKFQIHFLDGLIGMTASGDTERKIRAVMVGGRGHFGGKNKPITGIDRGVFLEAEVRLVILESPVRFEVTRKLKDVAVFIQFTLRGFSLFLFFLQFLSAEGMTGRFNQARALNNG